MGHVFHRHCKSAPPEIMSGEGCYFVDTNGKRYLDGSGGAAVSCLGHSDIAVKDAIKAQLDNIAFAHTGFFTSRVAEELADLLIDKAPAGIERAYLVSGGSEAVESALKLARQYYLEIGEPQRHRVIARLQSYHGNTMGALAAGGNMWRREPFQPLMIDTSLVPPCYAYRDKWETESDYDYGQRMANKLEAELLNLGPESVMAFIAEPVVGATMGCVPAVEGYFSRIRQICDQYGVLLILDEVMCGMGRTGTLFACEHDEIRPDIVTLAKGLGAGYQPIGAMLCSGKIYSAIENGSGFFQHGHTYNGHPMAAAASVAVIKAIKERQLLARVQRQGERLNTALKERFGQHPHVGDIRGRGLFRGLELVRDRETKQPFDANLGVSKAIKSATFEAGLVCYPMAGTLDGKKGDHILLAPPFIISDQQISELTDKLSNAINAVCGTGR